MKRFLIPAIAAQDWVRAAALSALFGFLAYTTYELTNLATVRGWSAQIALIDMAWGAALSGVAGTVGYLGSVHTKTRVRKADCGMQC